MTMLNPYNYSKPKRPVSMPMKQQPRNRQSQNSKGNAKSDSYLEQKVMSAKPEELTLMLYEGIIKFAKKAKMYNEKEDAMESNFANQRAQAILQELRATLDMTVEVSENFEHLYVYMIDRLIEANFSKDNSILDEVIELAEEFRDTWKTAMAL
jgi:flagellar protein FliS